MNKREKILAGLTASLVVMLMLFVIVNKLLLDPLRNLETQRVALVNDLYDLTKKNRTARLHRKDLESFASRTLGIDDERISEAARNRIVDQLAGSGLTWESLTPIRGTRKTGVYQEIGWSIMAKGRLDQVTNFLYLTYRDPHVHRLDNLVVSPVSGEPNTVKLQARYVTLRLEAGRGLSLSSLPIGKAVEVVDVSGIESKERATFAALGTRDVFRPYIKRPPVPKVVAKKPIPVASRPAAPVAAVPQFKVVGLPSWGDRHEVIVRNVAGNAVSRLKIGDTLGPGTIVAVDYRPMPLPTNPTIMSGSRVIIQIKDAYWGIEIGHLVSRKHLMTAEQLPPSLTVPVSEESNADRPQPDSAS